MTRPMIREPYASFTVKGAFVKQFSRRTFIYAALLFPLFLYAQPVHAESGISEKTAADTVRIPNSSHKKSSEPVHIKNSRSAASSDETVLPNSDETSPEGEQIQSTKFHPQTTIVTIPQERVKSKGKIIAGAALFGVSYGLSLIVAVTLSGSLSTADQNLAYYYYVPVLGPGLVGIMQTHSSSDAGPILLPLLGWSVAEGLGLTLLITGLVGSPAKPARAEATLSIEPLVMRDYKGLTVRMRF